MVESVLDIGFFSDIHAKISRKDAVPTLEKILSVSEFDFVVNGGDNEGKYARKITNMAKRESIPFVSVLGNHDLKELKKTIKNEYRIVDSYYKKGDINFYNQNIQGLSPTLDKWGYGIFGPKKNTRFVHSLADYLMYYLVVETNAGDIAVSVRHYPIYFNKQQDINMLKRIKRQYPDVKIIYALGGHTHSRILNIETQELNLSGEMVPVVSIVLPPFVLNENEVIGGIYTPSILDDGSLMICERYIKKEEVYETVLGTQIGDGFGAPVTVVEGELIART